MSPPTHEPGMPECGYPGCHGTHLGYGPGAGFCKAHYDTLLMRPSDARALWAVRVLDAWAERKPALAFTTEFFGCAATGVPSEDDHSEDWACVARNSSALRYLGSTPDAARLAAADAVFPELPSDVRAKLGERP